MAWQRWRGGSLAVAWDDGRGLVRIRSFDPNPLMAALAAMAILLALLAASPLPPAVVPAVSLLPIPLALPFCRREALLGRDRIQAGRRLVMPGRRMSPAEARLEATRDGASWRLGIASAGRTTPVGNLHDPVAVADLAGFLAARIPLQPPSLAKPPPAPRGRPADGTYRSSLALAIAMRALAALLAAFASALLYGLARGSPPLWTLLAALGTLALAACMALGSRRTEVRIHAGAIEVREPLRQARRYACADLLVSTPAMVGRLPIVLVGLAPRLGHPGRPTTILQPTRAMSEALAASIHAARAAETHGPRPAAAPVSAEPPRQPAMTP